ncbi:MAG: hypothetical protein EBT93_06890 [Alphaproteobacteria bacterium]|nr:hypothetical protein [Alphaproteobacteria bacterium]
MNFDLSMAQYVDLAQIMGARIQEFPKVFRLLSENHLRNGGNVTELSQVLDSWIAEDSTDFEFRFMPNRLLMPGTTCANALADIAALRDVNAENDWHPSALTPELPIGVSVDYSIAIADFVAPFFCANSLKSLEP